jgi:hypothetical protein
VLGRNRMNAFLATDLDHELERLLAYFLPDAIAGAILSGGEMELAESIAGAVYSD